MIAPLVLGFCSSIFAILVSDIFLSLKTNTSSCIGFKYCFVDCFGIPKAGSGFSSLKRFCKQCFQNVLTQTQKDFEEIKKFVEQTYSNNPDFFEDAYNYTLLEITSKKDWTFNIKLTPKITELY